MSLPNWINRIRVRQIQRAQGRELEALRCDRPFAEGMSHQNVHARLGDWIVRDRGTRVLELGCGPGKYVAMLANLGFDVVGVDPVGFKTWPELQRMPRVALHDGVSAETLPFDDGSFDHVVCLGAILYFDDPLKGLQEARRVLKPGGRLLLRTVNRDNLYSRRTGSVIAPNSKHLFTADELVELVGRAGFKAAESFCWGFWPSRFPVFWHYLDQVWLSPKLRDTLSNLLPPESRVSVSVFAEAADGPSATDAPTDPGRE